MKKVLVFLLIISFALATASNIAFAGGDKVRGDDTVQDNIEGTVRQVQNTLTDGDQPAGRFW